MAHSFNGTLKRIYIDSDLANVTVKELYSEWKEWAVLDYNLGYLQAFRAFGGDPTVEGQTAPAYYFLENGWRIVVDGFDATFGYNLYTSEGENPIITLNGGTALLNNSDVGIVKTELEETLDYNDVVHIDFDNGSSGQSYPLGTSGAPVDNFDDAVAIANSYGFNQIKIIRGSGRAALYMPNFVVTGVNPQTTTIELWGDLDDPEQQGNYRNTIFKNVTLTGTACGCGWMAERCTLRDVNEVAGYMLECGLVGTIGLSKRIDPETNDVFPSVFYQCVSEIPGFDSPVLDMVSGSPTYTSFRAYSGGLTLINADQPDDTATFEFVAGKLHVQPSCTDGEISVRGVVLVNDYSDGSVIDDSATVSKLVDLSNVSITTGDIAVDVDESAIAAEVVSQMDANSTKLAEISDSVETLDVTAITEGNASILEAIEVNTDKLDEVTIDITAVKVDTNELLEAGNSLRTSIDMLETGFSENDRLMLDNLENYDDESLVNRINQLELNVSSLAITPEDVWSAGTRELTQQVGLTTSQSNKLFSLENYDDTDVITKLGTIPLDTLSSTDARLSRLDANISSRASAVDVQVTVDGGFSNADRIALHGLENYDDTVVTSALDTVNTTLNQAKSHTDTLTNYTTLSTDLDNYTNKSNWQADVSALSVVNTNVNNIKTAVDNLVIPDKLTEGEIHTYLNSYPNKSSWKAIVPAVDLSPVLNAISALNDLSLAQIEGSTVLAKDATLSTITSIVAAIPTTDSVADLTPVLNAISQLNDVSPNEVRAAFDVTDFKDKNTEAEIHAWLDSYGNKNEWKVTAAEVTDEVWDRVV